jgi:hypothetical protein
VGGTSPETFLPGFFLGGSTQVLLNALFEMTVVRTSAGDGATAIGVSEKDGRGARGVTSGWLISESEDIETNNQGRGRRLLNRPLGSKLGMKNMMRWMA